MPMGLDDDGSLRLAGGVANLSGYLAPTEAEEAYGLLASFVIPSSYLYLPATPLPERTALADYMPDALAGILLKHLDRLLHHVPPALRARTHGFEVWSTRASLTGDDRLYLHIDCDEALRTSTGVIRTPLLGSVLYLGPTVGLVGGETAVITHEELNAAYPPFQFHDWRQLAREPRGVHRFSPVPGTLALFDGRLNHAQAPVRAQPAGTPRVVLLANLWDGPVGHVPKGLCRVAPDVFQAKAFGR